MRKLSTWAQSPGALAAGSGACRPAPCPAFPTACRCVLPALRPAKVSLCFDFFESPIRALFTVTPQYMCTKCRPPPPARGMVLLVRNCVTSITRCSRSRSQKNAPKVSVVRRSGSLISGVPPLPRPHLRAEIHQNALRAAPWRTCATLWCGWCGRVLAVLACEDCGEALGRHHRRVREGSCLPSGGASGGSGGRR